MGIRRPRMEHLMGLTLSKNNCVLFGSAEARTASLGGGEGSHVLEGFSAALYCGLSYKGHFYGFGYMSFRMSFMNR